jgi:DNA polymerase I-like protein with 3'-5' exonuclease and polymerase domains
VSDFHYPSLLGPITIDTETHDPLLRRRGAGWCYSRYGDNGGRVIGIAIKCESYHGYIPIAHLEGNQDRQKVIAWLNYELNKDRMQEKIFFNAIYDLGWLRSEGVTVTGIVHDVAYQAPLLDEYRFNYSLDAIAKDYLGSGKNEKTLEEEAERLGIKNNSKDNIKMHLARLHPDLVTPYAMGDVEVTERLFNLFQPKIIKEDLKDVYQLELDLLPMLLEMRFRGVHVDIPKAEELQHKLIKDEQAALDIISNSGCGTFTSEDITKAAVLAKAFDNMGMAYPITEITKKPSIKDGWLLANASNPVCKAMYDARKAHRIRSMFVEAFVLDLSENGKVHPEFNPLKSDKNAANAIGVESAGGKGTVGGRFSSSNPNFQQIPSAEKDPILGKLVRSLFLPNPGERWGSLDYSSQEPRITVHFAELIGAPKSKEIGDKYREDPNTDFHTFTRDLVRSILPDFDRKPAKIIGLSLTYGMGGGTLAERLGLPAEERELYGRLVKMAGPEAQTILDAFNQGVPFIQTLKKAVETKAKRAGFIITPTGRRFRFPFEPMRDKDQIIIRDSNNSPILYDGEGGRNYKRMYVNKALSRLIQGTAAEMTKISLREMWRAGICPLGTVHDENNISYGDQKTLRLSEEIMVTSFPLTVPVVVDVEVGPNWGEAVKEEI